MNTERLIDELEDIVYVSDPVTNELLYVNQKGRNRLGELYQGKKCYEYIRGADAPCSFCNNQYLLKNQVKDHYHIWESINEYAGSRHYMNKDKLIMVDGRQVRLELAVDITVRENLSKVIEEKLEVERILVECIRALVGEKHLSNAINITLSYIGGYYQADRAYIFEFDTAWIDNTYEWCATGVHSLLDQLQHFEMHIEEVTEWLELFSNQNVVTLQDLQRLRERFPQQFDLLNRENIHGMMAVPLRLDNELRGFIGVDNPKRSVEGVTLMESLAYFITEFLQKRKTETRIKQMSYHDPLTGLYNRYQYTEKLQALTSRPPAHLGIVYMDIDGLKKVNESYGHSYGDLFITEIADTLRRYFPEKEIYRIGGDEFVVASESMDQNTFQTVCAQVEHEFLMRDRCSVSVGYIWSDRNINVLNLSHAADQLMYLNKQNSYRKKRLANYHHKPLLLDDLLKAIEEGEFVVYLQAQVDAVNGEVTGAEALVRRISPKKGFIPPDQFIPLLEQEFIIKYVDFYVYRTVCALLDRWYQEGRQVRPISVNFSRLTLMEPHFVEQLVEIRNQYQFPRELVEIEITESTDKMSYDNMIRVVSAIRKNGFRIALDDFGTKYTSLSLFTEMDVDVVKLDKSLIDGLEENSKSRLIVKDALMMCKELGAKSVAEGVETREQLDILRRLGCDYIQGYLYSKPIPVGDFETIYCPKPDYPHPIG